MAHGAIELILEKLEVFTETVTEELEKGEAEAMRHAGAFIRKVIIQGMGKDPGPSDPGKPPHQHSNPFLANSIQFAYYEDEDKTLVVGPAEHAYYIGALHEFGGRKYGHDYPARPFMEPGYRHARESGKLDEFWADCITS